MDLDNGRRQAPRNIPPEGESAAGTLIVDRRRIAVLILDESMEGVGLVAVHVGSLDIGDVVHFHSTVRNLEARVGNIRHVRIEEESICRIGLQWTN